VLKRLHNTWIALAIATLAVVVSGSFIVRSFLGHVFIDCRGSLVRLDAMELGDRASNELEKVKGHDLEVRYDEVRSEKSYARARVSYKNVRVQWTPSDAPRTCSEVSIPWDRPLSSPATLTIRRDEVTGLFVVRDGATSIVFRKIDNHGHRFQSDRVLDGHNVSMLVFLCSLVALAIGASHAMRAAPYARRMHAWQPATLRPDGVVESETGATLGRMDTGPRARPGGVIVDPSAFEGRDIYREMPMLTRRSVGIGTHERWLAGTMRRLRDARSLAIIATMTTSVALVARFLG
jgi:hypothetical protein